MEHKSILGLDLSHIQEKYFTIFILLYMYVWVFCLHICLCTNLLLQRPGEGIRSPGTRVIGSYEQFDMDARNQAQVLSRALYSCECWAISSAPEIAISWKDILEVSKSRKPNNPVIIIQLCVCSICVWLYLWRTDFDGRCLSFFNLFWDGGGLSLNPY